MKDKNLIKHKKFICAFLLRNPLKVIVEGDNDIKLFPEDDELINILNIKRGIISAMAVPVLQEEKNKEMVSSEYKQCLWFPAGIKQATFTINLL